MHIPTSIPMSCVNQTHVFGLDKHAKQSDKKQTPSARNMTHTNQRPIVSRKSHRTNQKRGLVREKLTQVTTAR